MVVVGSEGISRYLGECYRKISNGRERGGGRSFISGWHGVFLFL
jgi:hypothetical protein